MKFWEAMKALEEGKRIKGLDWNHDQYIFINDQGMIIMENGEDFFTEHDFSNLTQVPFELLKKEPDLYWQWRCRTEGKITRILREPSGIIGYGEKHAGPWIKTEDGFKKHETWEQL